MASRRNSYVEIAVNPLEARENKGRGLDLVLDSVPISSEQFITFFQEFQDLGRCVRSPLLPSLPPSLSLDHPLILLN
jgi:hypothetical protein